MRRTLVCSNWCVRIDAFQDGTYRSTVLQPITKRIWLNHICRNRTFRSEGLFLSWVLQSNKSRNFDFSMLLSLTIDRSACIGKPLIAEAVHCICKDKGFEGSLSIARKNCILFLQYFFLYLSNRKVITSLTRKSLASKGLLKIYAHIKMADPTLISFRALFFYL